MAVATTEADEAIASSVFVQIMGIPLKKLLAGVFLVTSPRLILRSGYGHAMTNFVVQRGQSWNIYVLEGVYNSNGIGKGSFLFSEMT